MTGAALDDIEAWSSKLSPWRRDCLRRLAVSSDLTATDLDDLLAMIRATAGLATSTAPPSAAPFTKAHFGGGTQSAIVLKGVANIQNVNRLVAGARVDFCPKALTIVYGRNGSGKSGFVRILRTACRTRVENPAKLKVLADVYGSAANPQSADIIIDIGAGDAPISWAPGMTADPLLMQVAVFDTLSAQLYVDGGNQIRYLPFGLALPHRLNNTCLTLKEKIEAERAVEVGDKLDLTTIGFPIARDTAAQKFDRNLSATSKDAEIAAATVFDDLSQKRLDEISGLLTTSAATTADVSALANWVAAVKLECDTAVATFEDTALAALKKLAADATAARAAAKIAADQLFTDEPLPGVGSDTWRTLWSAARDFSLLEAYPTHPHPVTKVGDEAAACVLCQQLLQPNAAARMERFRDYMDDALDVVAQEAEAAVAAALAGLVQFEWLQAPDFGDRLEQIKQRDASLAQALAAFQPVALGRREAGRKGLTGEAGEVPSPLISPTPELDGLLTKLDAEKAALKQASHADERLKLEIEKAELEDRKTLAAGKADLVSRRNLLVKETAYAKALAEVNTKGITQKANEFLDTYLTTAVADRFNEERARFDIMHLNVALTRKSGQTKAEFAIDPQTKIAKITSEILSEGEQRALALSGFLTEVALTDGSGPVVIDDPVSSLDRDRSVRVAERLAEEATKRQVIVFTHDMVFFNELCRAADDHSIEPVTIALFSDKQAAGKIDKAGMVWKGLNVAKRIGQLKNDAAGLPKLHGTSPAGYEFQIKNLYGRLRDTYERVVEEVIFRDIVRRGVDVVQTQLLRYVTLSDALALQFHDGMTRANTHSHDNPAADTVTAPSPDDFKADIAALEKLVSDLKAASDAAEAARPQMKPKAK